MKKQLIRKLTISFIMLLISIVLITTSNAAFELTIGLTGGKTDIKVGDEVEITISLNEAIVACDFEVKYNQEIYQFEESETTGLYAAVNGNKLSGYYLVYQKVNNVYKVYKVNVQNKDIITYLFTTTDINSIKCNNEYIFFKDSKEIKYFNDLIGVKTLLKYNELEFNNKLNFYVYSK